MVRNLHPVIRVLGLIALAFACAIGHGIQLVLVTLLLLIATLFTRNVDWRAWFQALRRLRWLFVSLAVLFFWFTPGEPLFALGLPAAIVPTWEGLALGAQRMFSLVLIVTGAQLLLQSTSRPELLHALYVLSWPLAVIPGLRERFALRLVLTMERVASVQLVVTQARMQSMAGRGALRARWGELVHALFARTLVLADQAGTDVIFIDQYERPPLWQWVALLVVGALLMAG